MKYEMVYFDLDGTLLDFAKAERESIRAVLEEFGIPLSDDQIQTYVEINKKWWRLFSEGKASKDRIIVARFEEFLSWLGHPEISPLDVSQRYLEKLSNCAYFLPGAEEFLTKMKTLNVKMAALTNGVQSVQERRAKLLRLERFFEFMITSELAGKPKPDPAMFLLAARVSGVPLRRSVYVGDDPVVDYLAAKNAGTDFVLLDLDSVHFNFDGRRVSSYEELFNLLICESISS
jgi:YjjG family noncanonical pyrimidine nucleotidase